VASVGLRPPANVLAQLNDSLERLASTVAPAVVQIEAMRFGPADDADRKTAAATIVRQHAIGAGVVVDASGFIKTNAHVIDGARRIRVAPSIVGRVQRLEAKVIGVERQSDLALLKIEARDLPVLRFNANPPEPGELVVAIGSPNDLENSVSMGVISSAWRQPDPDNLMPNGPAEAAGIRG
jgi:S1-C subfamily serine protease